MTTASALTARLHAIVRLTPAQRIEARTIYRQAQVQLQQISTGTRSPHQDRSIRAKMNADIHALLTPGQRAPSTPRRHS